MTTLPENSYFANYIVTLNYQSQRIKSDLVNKVFSEFEYFYGATAAISFHSEEEEMDFENSEIFCNKAFTEGYRYADKIKSIFPKEELKIVLDKNPFYYSEEGTEAKYFESELMRYSIIHDNDPIIEISMFLHKN